MAQGRPSATKALKAKAPKALEAAIVCMPGRLQSTTTVICSGLGFG